jgi:peroxiredoxin (alkyl hydroperoxide reductase subunit C)
MKKRILAAMFVVVSLASNAFALSDAYKGNIYQVGKLKPVDSVLKVKVGQIAPDFTLKAVSGKKVSLKDYIGQKNIVLSFVPAAWTPVCSDQWPGYNIVQDLFEENNSVLLGISVDNIPTLYSWTKQMGHLWFEVLSDFWPHGAVASRYGILRSDGTAERAIIIIDKKGIIRYIDVHDINQRPPLESIIHQLEKLR